LGIFFFLRFLAAKGFNQFAEFPWRHVVMVGLVFDDYRPQRTGTQAVDLLHGKKTVRGYLTRFNPELAYCLVEEKLGISNVTGGALAQGKNIPPGWFQSKGFIERGYPVDLNNRYTQTLRHGLHGLFGNVTVVFLNVLKHFNKLIWLTAASFQDLVEYSGRHIKPP